jgi:hypothetical protein
VSRAVHTSGLVIASTFEANDLQEGVMMEYLIDQTAQYALEEVAALKEVLYATVRSAIHRGEVVATKRDRDWLVRGSDVIAWMPHRWTPASGGAQRDPLPSLPRRPW